MHIHELTAAEENLMHAIWPLEQFYLRELLEGLPEPKPHQNTVSTYLKILVEKGFLEIRKQGRVFLYIPVVSRVQYRNFLLHKLLSKYENGSAKGILTYFFEENLIKADDLRSFFNVSIEMLPQSQKNAVEHSKIRKDQKEKQADKKKKKKRK